MFPISERQRNAIVDLCQAHRVRRLYLFGSATGGQFNPATSDMDFLVSFFQMPPVEHADSYFGLLEGLETLLGRDVDLVEEEAVVNPFFRRSVERSRVTLYAA